MWEQEREDLLKRFDQELRKATGDGSKKRQAGTKPPWWEDETHQAAFARHYARWLTDPQGRDEDSGAHHLVAAGWRLLAIACQESGNTPNLKLLTDHPIYMDNKDEL